MSCISKCFLDFLTISLHTAGEWHSLQEVAFLLLATVQNLALGKALTVFHCCNLYLFQSHRIFCIVLSLIFPSKITKHKIARRCLITSAPLRTRQCPSWGCRCWVSTWWSQVCPFFPGRTVLKLKKKSQKCLECSRKMWRCLGGPRIQDIEWQYNHLHLHLFSHLPLPHGVKLLPFLRRMDGWTMIFFHGFRLGAGFQRVKRGDETFRSAYQRHAEVRRTSSGPWTLRHLMFINFCPQKGGEICLRDFNFEESLRNLDILTIID